MKAYVIVSISKYYTDIYEIFFELMRINWHDCKWDIIEISDLDEAVYGKHHVKKNDGDTIPDCIYRATEKFPADFYLFFLGDAFITKRVNNISVNHLLSEMQKNNYDYCNLFKNPVCRSEKQFKKLKKTESYGVQFITFIASKDFIVEEFEKSITDFEFEQKYLLLSSKAQSGYYENYIVADREIFGVLHGINKSCWIRKSYRFLKNNYPTICLGNRKKQSIKNEIYEDLAFLSTQLMKTSTRSRLRKLLNKTRKKFYTEY